MNCSHPTECKIDAGIQVACQGGDHDDDIGPTISHNVTKVLEECVRAMVDQLPPSSVQKNKGRVKRPMNAFMVYSQTARKAMAKVYPNLSYRKLSKALGKNWGIMGIEEKKPFMREAERLRQKHKQEYPDYKFKPANKPRQPPSNFTKRCHTTNTTIAAPKMQSDRSNTSSCQYSVDVSPTLNVCEKLSFPKRNNFGEATSLQAQRTYFSANNIEVTRQVNDIRSYDKFTFEEERVPFLGYGHILNGSQEMRQRESSSTQPAIYPLNHLQPAGNHAAYKDSSLHPSLQGFRGVSCKCPPGGAEPGFLPEVDLFNFNQPTYTGELNGTFPSDFVNFCNFITTEKQVFRTPIHTTSPNDFTF